jgi:hypothetical protein
MNKGNILFFKGALSFFCDDKRKDNIVEDINHYVGFVCLTKLTVNQKSSIYLKAISLAESKQIINFHEGFKAAISKYGVEEGCERIKDKLIEIILDNDEDYHHSREELLKTVISANLFADLNMNGIHLTKDENGEYHEC